VLRPHYVRLDLVGTARHGLPHEGHEWSLSAPLWYKCVTRVWAARGGDRMNPGSIHEYHAARDQFLILGRWPA
jgi:hypothetical protein